MNVLLGLTILMAAYLVGSIPCGLLLCKAKGLDIRRHGSGNIGATNVRRVLGKKWAVGCFLCDFAKGFVPVMLTVIFAGRSWADWLPVLVAVASIAGHVWPVYLRFQGGKGVATSAGALCPVAPLAIIVCIMAWGVVFGLTRYVSVASLTAAVVLPVTGLMLYTAGTGTVRGPDVVLLAVAGALVVYRHQSNIARLVRGEENRFSSKGGSN